MIELTMLTQGQSCHDDWVDNADAWARVVMTADIGNADKKARDAMMIELTMLTQGPELPWWLSWQCWHKGQSCHDDWVDNSDTRPEFPWWLNSQCWHMGQSCYDCWHWQCWHKGQSCHNSWVDNADTWARVVMTVDIGNADKKAKVAVNCHFSRHLERYCHNLTLLTQVYNTQEPSHEVLYDSESQEV